MYQSRPGFGNVKGTRANGYRHPRAEGLRPDSTWPKYGLGANQMAGFGPLDSTNPIFGLAPGDPCYDPTFMPGLVHDANFIQAMFNSNATMSTSPAEALCLATGKTPQPLAVPAPPTVPGNLDPNLTATYDPSGNVSTSGNQDNLTMGLSPAATLVNYGCIGGPGDASCINGGNGAFCAWWCGLPFSDSFDSTCTDCPMTAMGYLIVAGAVLGTALAVLGKVR